MLRWSQGHHWKVILTSMFICVLANQLLPFTHCPSQTSSIFYIQEDVRLKEKPLVTVWLTFQSDTQIPFAELNRQQYRWHTHIHTHTHRCRYLFTRTSLCVSVKACVCCLWHTRTLLPHLSRLSGLLFSLGPILSSISRRPCLSDCALQRMKGEWVWSRSHWYSALKHNSANVWSWRDGRRSKQTWYTPHTSKLKR